MKKVKFFCLTALLFSASAFAADYTWNGSTWGYWVDGYKNGWNDIPVTTTWTNVDGGAPLVGAPTSADSFSYNGTATFGIHIMGKDLADLQDGDPTLYIKSLSVQTTQDISLATVDGASTGSWSLTNWSPVTLNVADSITLKTSGSAGFGTASTGSGYNYIYIGKNFDVSEVSGGTSLTFYYKHANNVSFTGYSPYSESDPSIIVGEQIKLGSTTLYFKQGASGTNEAVYPIVQLGGLTGDNAKIVNYDVRTDQTTFVFKAKTGETFQGGEFSGTFFDVWRANGNGAPGSKFNIVMDGGASGGLQTIRLTDTSNYSGISNASAAGEINVNIRSGKIALGNTENADKFTSVQISGGTLYADGNTKKIKVGALELDGGSLILNAYADSVDTVEADSVSGDGTAIFIDLSTEDFSVNEDLSGRSFDIFSGTADVSYLTESNIKFRYNGTEFAVDWDWNNGALLVNSGTVIPEPATIAAIFGAFALAFAAYRRRK